jgi:hypothetical protein
VDWLSEKKSHNNETGVFSNIHFDAAQNGLGFGSYTSNRKYLFSVLMIKILQMFARHMRQSVNLGSAAGGVSPLIVTICNSGFQAVFGTYLA